MTREIYTAMDEINSLRQQLSAAEFLVASLKAKLRQAEEQHAAQQQFHAHQLPRYSPDGQATPEQASAGAKGTRQLDDREVISNPHADLDPKLAGEPMDESAVTLDSDAPHGDDELSLSQPTEPIELPVPNGVELPNIDLKTVFPDLAAVKEAVEAYALAQGWTPHTKKRDRLRICMGCRSLKSCPYHLRAETCADGARISASKLAHTCGGNLNVKRHHTSRMVFLREEVPKFMNVTPQTPAKEIQEAVFRRYGTRISLAQCTKLKGRSRTKRPAFQGCGKCGEGGHNKKTCKA